MPVLLLDDNLMSSHRLATALERAGEQVVVMTSIPADLSGLEAAVINLGSRTIDGISLLRQLKREAPALRVVGFCGHLETERRQAAREAGCDRLVTNSRLAEDPLGAIRG